MTQAELIKELSGIWGTSWSDADRRLKDVVDVMKIGLQETGQVKLRNFGTVLVVKRKGRWKTLPNGTKSWVNAHNTVIIKTSDQLKHEVRNVSPV